MTATLSRRQPQRTVRNDLTSGQLPRMIELWLLLAALIVVGAP
jgi:hypothetical protein